MLETGIGRAPNLALAALPGLTLPGDTSASSRYFAEDLTEPFELRDGHLTVPSGPGTGIARLRDPQTRFTVARRTLYRAGDRSVGLLRRTVAPAAAAHRSAPPGRRMSPR